MVILEGTPSPANWPIPVASEDSKDYKTPCFSQNCAKEQENTRQNDYPCLPRVRAVKTPSTWACWGHRGYPPDPLQAGWVSSWESRGPGFGTTTEASYLLRVGHSKEGMRHPWAPPMERWWFQNSSERPRGTATPISGCLELQERGIQQG